MSTRIAQLERAIEAALQPGRYIDYNTSGRFMDGVEAVADDVTVLIGDGHAEEAVALFETFIAATYEKIEEVDDSSGSFGGFAGELFCEWARARQAAAANPEETAALLLTWMINDDYGFCSDLELGLVEVLDAAGLDAFAGQLCALLDASTPDGRGPDGYPLWRWTVALKRVLAARGDAEA